MSIIFTNDGSLESKMKEVLKKCEDIVELSFKASGGSVMDALSGLDAETGAMIGSAMTLYKNAKDLAVMQSSAMDKMLDDFEELKEMNQTLRKQNDDLQQLLRDLNQKVEKLVNKD